MFCYKLGQSFDAHEVCIIMVIGPTKNRLSNGRKKTDIFSTAIARGIRMRDIMGPNA